MILEREINNELCTLIIRANRKEERGHSTMEEDALIEILEDTLEKLREVTS